MSQKGTTCICISSCTAPGHGHRTAASPRPNHATTCLQLRVSPLRIATWGTSLSPNLQLPCQAIYSLHPMLNPSSLSCCWPTWPPPPRGIVPGRDPSCTHCRCPYLQAALCALHCTSPSFHAHAASPLTFPRSVVPGRDPGHPLPLPLPTDSGLRLEGSSMWLSAWDPAPWVAIDLGVSGAGGEGASVGGRDGW